MSTTSVPMLSPERVLFVYNNEIVQTHFVYNRFLIEGEYTVVDIIQEMYNQNKSFPSMYDILKCKENELTMEEVEYILDKSLEMGLLDNKSNFMERLI